MTSARRQPASPGSSGGSNSQWIIIGAIALGIIGLGYLLYLNVRPDPPIEGVVVFPRPSRGHDDTVRYEYGGLPPVGGTHNNAWQNCGIYDEPIAAEHIIHSMEHGTVWISYRPDLSDADVETLRDYAREQDGFIMISVWPEQESSIVMTAWGVQLSLDSVDDNRIEAFIDKYRVGPQTPERGATCQRGVGVPIE
ncbi:MAG: DUF3105 domain-containing protein [Chloroflexota bacterium]